MSDVIATNVNAGDDPLAEIVGAVKAVGVSFQQMTNQWAALSAQNRDIESGAWTLNNFVFQFKELPQATQNLLIAAATFAVLKFAKVI